MRLFFKSKDGGPESTVTGYFLIEWKQAFSIALLRFDKGSRENFHNHAFNAFTLFLFGSCTEYFEDGTGRDYRSLRLKRTPRNLSHKVYAHKKSWAVTVRGPWTQTWQETTPFGKIITLTHGRKVINLDP